MSLENEIRAVLAEMPLEDHAIINAAFSAIANTCALADKLGGPDKMLGAVAVALLGARYQDNEEGTSNPNL